jgi:hypothetical protein
MYMSSTSSFNGALSFAVVKKQVAHEIKRGGLSRKDARSIVDGARAGYRKRNYERVMDRKNAH